MREITASKIHYENERMGDLVKQILDLSIAKAVAEKHGGNISVACQDGKVRFTVSIPVKNK